LNNKWKRHTNGCAAFLKKEGKAPDKPLDKVFASISTVPDDIAVDPEFIGPVGMEGPFAFTADESFIGIPNSLTSDMFRRSEFSESGTSL
jgi:hypothetical protein